MYSCKHQIFQAILHNRITLYHYSISKYLSTTMALHNFVRPNGRGFIDINQDSILRIQHNSEAISSYEQNMRSLMDHLMVILHDSNANSIWG